MQSLGVFPIDKPFLPRPSCHTLPPHAQNDHPPPASDESDPEVQQLRTRAEELRLRLEDRNALIKAAIDRLRQLLDALCMWDSSRRELQATAG